MQQTSYLEWGSLMWMLPLYLHVNQKSNDDDDDDDDDEDGYHDGHFQIQTGTILASFDLEVTLIFPTKF